MRAGRAGLRYALVSGMVFFAIVMSMGQVLADPTSSQGGTVGGVVSGTAPVISLFDIKDTTATPATVIGTQIQVLTTYTFNFRVNAPNGWNDITLVAARVWHDGGNDATTYTGQSSGANWKASLSASFSNVGAPAVGDFGAIDGRMDYVSASSSVTPVVAGQTYDFVLAFQFHDQMRAAKTPAALSTSAFNNANSWNAEIQVTDASSNNVVLYTQTGTGYYFEFGVATYTSLTFTGSWTATSSIAPGGNSNTNAVTITRISNFDFQVYAYFTGDLINTGDASKTIPVNGNVLLRLVAGSDMSGDATFAGTGVGNPVFVFGTTTTYHAMDAGVDSSTFSTTFNIAVPLGTATGTYQATVVFVVNQNGLP